MVLPEGTGCVVLTGRRRARRRENTARSVVTLENRRCGRSVLYVALNSSARETSLSHNPANTRVIKDRYNELFKLDLDGEKWLLLLLLNAASSLVSLSSLECSNESIGERRLCVEQRARCCWEPVEGDIEAKLKGSALKRVRCLVWLRFETSPSQGTGS
ncbi:hypothetical protein V8G54_008843 [Vigna mungo]|uniref:Uncharacterized protein n=1 Tax=Vigna mungo TaxID=3915 RepID=A0AAQ3P3X4_VIGMU